MTEFNSTATTASTAGGNTLSKAAEKWFIGRGIDPETAIRCGVYTQGEGLNTVVVYPFLENGVVVNRKYRAYDPETKRFKKLWQDKNPKKTFVNADAIRAAAEAGQPLVITEGEQDWLALEEAGYPYVCSVPDGAPSKRNNDPVDQRNDLKYEFLWNNWDALEAVTTIILAGDDDEPGRNLNHELSRRLGADRCRFIEYPKQEHNFGTEDEPAYRRCKDLNDVLIAFGPTATRSLIDNAKLYPVKGLMEFRDFPERRNLVTYDTKIQGLSDHLKLLPGKLFVTTGIPGHGKSTFVDCLIFNMAFYHGWHCCTAVYEAEPNEEWRDDMVVRYRAQLVDNARPTESDAEQWIQDSFTFVGRNPTDDDDEDLTLEDLIENAEISVVRYGSKILLLDPWNEIEHRRRRDETETDYINRAIRSLKRFARRFDVLVIVVAHPTKMNDHGKVRMPTLYDISGSANWANKADYGAIVWRDDVSEGGASKIKLAKIKKHGLMGKPGTIELELDKNSMTYFPYAPGAFGNTPIGQAA